MRQPPKRVLCVEDHEDIRFLLTTFLRGAGYDAASAAGTAEAEGLARGGHFDLFVLDTRLDDGSGVDLCRTLLSISPGARVIFYSAAAYETDREEAMRAGAWAYVAKPGTDELLGAVRGALGDERGLAAADES